MMIDKNSPVPQYFQLQTWLIEQIEQGFIQPNEKISTEEELTQKTGLARATIRQAGSKNATYCWRADSGYLQRLCP
jgi:GntR family transcriptional regulator